MYGVMHRNCLHRLFEKWAVRARGLRNLPLPWFWRKTSWTRWVENTGVLCWLKYSCLYPWGIIYHHSWGDRQQLCCHRQFFWAIVWLSACSLRYLCFAWRGHALCNWLLSLRWQARPVSRPAESWGDGGEWKGSRVVLDPQCSGKTEE